MRIGIVGGGASGAYLAIRLKELNPSFNVTIFERNDRLLKKISVTGNGRCNYATFGWLVFTNFTSVARSSAFSRVLR